jgi:hypothetical protein
MVRTDKKAAINQWAQTEGINERVGRDTKGKIK